MVTPMRYRLFFVLLSFALPLMALAEDSPAAVQSRLDAEIACIERIDHSLSATQRLLTEARTQLANSPPGSPAGRDAAASVVSLEQRVVSLAHDLAACVPSSAGRAGHVVYIDPVRDQAAERVAQDAPSLEVLERDVSLSSNVRVSVAEKVDGRGRVGAASVNASVASLSRPLDACYGQLVDRGALVSGRAQLVFTVTSSGSVTEVRTAGVTLGDSRFTRCLRDAGHRLHVGEPAVGGDATYSYTLEFGPN